MKEMPLVSIVLPVYNGSDFLAKSIESCIAQTYKNWELIIVNDCSKDNSLEIARNFALGDMRIRVLDNEHNLKLPASLNRGFQEAQGNYYTWTSHDNIMNPQMLEKFVDYLVQNTDIGLVTANYTVIDSSDKILYTVEHPDPALFMPLGNGIGYAFMYKKEILTEIGEYDTNLFLIEDYDYWIRIWLKYKVGKIYESLYFTRVHEKTLTLERKDEIAQKLYEIRLRYFDAFYSSLNEFPQLQYKFLISILEHPTGKEKRDLQKRFFRLNFKYFAPRYLFLYVPKKKLRKTILFRKLKSLKNKK